MSQSFPVGPDSLRVLPWLDRYGQVASPSECALCSAQLLFPASRLLRVVAHLAPEQRSAQMVAFAQAYAGLIAEGHVLRYTSQPVRPFRRVAGISDTLVVRWEQQLRGKRWPAPPYQWQLLDVDLWVIGSAAELVDAQQAAPDLLGLSDQTVTRLRRVVRAGASLLARSASAPQVVTDSAGRRLQRRSFFDGEFDAHPDMAYAGWADSVLPEAPTPRRLHGASWDVSHVSRLPQVLRALRETRRATGIAIGADSLIQGAVNQLLYAARRPEDRGLTFHNFFDGSDGWYRVGYEGRKDWGYAPGRYCSNAVPGRLCLTRGAVFGWGVLAYASPGLDRYYQDLFALTRDPSPDAAAFRARFFAIGWDSFGWSADPAQASGLLFRVACEYLLGLQPPTP